MLFFSVVELKQLAEEAVGSNPMRFQIFPKCRSSYQSVFKYCGESHSISLEQMLPGSPASDIEATCFECTGVKRKLVYALFKQQRHHNMPIFSLIC